MKIKSLLTLVFCAFALSTSLCATETHAYIVLDKSAPNMSVEDYKGMSFITPSAKTPHTSAKNPDIEIDVSPFTKRDYKYIYILHSVEKTNSQKFNGRIVTTFSDGRKRYTRAIEGRDIAATNAPAIVLDNALPIEKINGFGQLYLSRFIIQYGASAGAQPAKPEKLMFSSPHKWSIAGITFSSEEITTTQNYFFDPKIWKPIDTTDLVIKSGSALDLSNQMFGAPCGKNGRVIIGKSGKFEFENKPNQTLRFKGTNLRLANRFPVKEEVVDPSAPKVVGELVSNHADIDAYVKILKKQGYNAVRWRPAMRGKAEYDAPYKLKPEIQDLYDYYVYALKREGVYIFYYLCSNDDGRPDFRWDERQTLKMKMMLADPQTRENWKKLARMQLEHVNPYTNMALKDDPVIATLECWNEFEIGAENYPALTAEGKELLRKRFIEFAKNKYGTLEKFLADNPKWKNYGKLKTFDNLNVNITQNRTSKVYAHFIIEAMRETHTFWRKFIREEMGMKTVPMHQNNCNKRVYWNFIGAEGGEYVAVNSYFAHPNSYLIGGFVNGASEFESDAFFWRNTAARKVAGMAHTVTEYQHCHFNKYKHEAALTFPAYSALNDYDGLIIFDAAVAPRGGEIGYFNVAENPVFRANDFINFFLFYRGDVAKSPNRVDILCDANTMLHSENIAQIPIERTKIALMTGFAFNFPTAKRTLRTSVEPAKMTLSLDKPFNITKVTKELKACAILPADNISDPKNGIYQSDTGQITMLAHEKTMKVVTPKSEAIIMRAEMKNQKLGKMTVKSSTADAAVALSAIDNKPIPEADRLVLTYNTDAIMSNFGVSKNRCYVTAWGEMPVLIETGKLELEIALSPAKKYRVWALKLNGERLREIETQIQNGVMQLSLDTANYPTVFFEIQAQ